MQHELESILERPIDFISRRALEESPNWIRRHAILNTAQILYCRDEGSEEVWNTARNDIPDMLTKITPLLPQQPEG
jgi:hypothetical protein